MAPPAKNAKFRQIPEMQSSPISPNRIPALFTKLGQRPPEKPQKFMKRLTFEPLPCYGCIYMKLFFIYFSNALTIKVIIDLCNCLHWNILYSSI